MQSLEQSARHPNMPPQKTVWYGIGKAIESQLPHKHAERLQDIIRTQIVPRLSDAQVDWVRNHATGIYRTTQVAGVAVTATEIALATIAVNKGNDVLKKFFKSQSKIPKNITNIPRPKTPPMPYTEAVNKDTLLSPFMDQFLKQTYGPNALEQSLNLIKDAYTTKYNKQQGADTLKQTYITMASLAKQPGVQEQFRSIVTMLNQNDAVTRQNGENLLKTLFTKAYTRSRWGAIQSPSTQLHLQAQGIRLFDQWKNIQFAGVIPLLSYATTEANALMSPKNRDAQKQVRRAGNILTKHRNVTDFDKRIDRNTPVDTQLRIYANTKHSFDTLRREGAPLQSDRIMKPPSKPEELYDERKALEVILDENINAFKKEQEKKKAEIHAIFSRIHNRESEKNLRAILETDMGLGKFSSRLDRNLKNAASYQSLDPRSKAMLKTLLITAHEKQNDPAVKKVLTKVQSYWWDQFNQGSRGYVPSMTPEERQSASEAFFSTLIDMQPDGSISTFDRANKKDLIQHLATYWQHDRAGLSVLRSEDINAIVKEIGPTKTTSMERVPWQMRLAISSIKKNIHNPDIAGPIKVIMNKGAYDTTDENRRTPKNELVHLVGVAMKKLPKDIQQHVSLTNVEHLAAQWINEGEAAGLSEIYEATKQK